MKTNIRKTNIVCTIGPASENKLEEMLEAGMNVARINFSHGSYPEQKEKIEKLLEARKKTKRPVALLLDMQGPEIRTGMLETGKNEPVMLETGTEFILKNDEVLGNSKQVTISYKDLYKDVKVGDTILIDDGSIQLKVNKIKEKDIYCKVIHGNKLGSRKTVNVPGVAVKLPGLKEKDIQDLKDGARVGFDYVAASFVRNKEDVLAIRKVLDENGGKNIKIICKIENQEGVNNFEDILANSDGIMVARGDMAVEVDYDQVPIIQKRFIRRCNEEGKPVITATQMLDTMQKNPTPTRAEVSDVANAVFDRTSSVMLSGESATGLYPVKCVETMDQISKSVEQAIKYWKRFQNTDIILDPNDLEQNIAYTTCITAKHLKADAIVAYTHKGDSIRKISGIGPGCPILAVTDNEKTYHQLALVWNVYPVLAEGEKTIEDTISKGIKRLKKNGILEKGDTVVLAGGAKILPDKSENKVIGGVMKI